MKQATIKKSVILRGTGLHTGEAAEVEFIPAQPGKGIVIENNGEAYGLDVRYVAGTGRGTVLKKGKSTVHTVEHMLSAIKAFGIDNIRIRLSGCEVPALDGSARLFAGALIKAGIVRQEAEKKVFTLAEPVLLKEKDKRLAALPGRGFSAYYFSDFSGRGIQPEEAGIEITTGKYFREISGARTFGFKDEIEALKKAGLIKGANLKNAVVMDGNKPVNGRLRYRNELTRHKVLDMIGDFSFIEGEINMTLIGYKTGHTENIKMVRKILNS